MLGHKVDLRAMQEKKSDALRNFIMHAYGGLYLDLDVQCYKPSEASLQHMDLVLQGTGYEGINNALMASIPGIDAPILLHDHGIHSTFRRG